MKENLGLISWITARARVVYLRRRFGRMGRGCAFQSPGPAIIGGRRIELGDGVFGRPYIRLEIVESAHSPASGAVLVIGEGAYLGFHVSIFATRKITIGRDAYLNGHVTLYDHYPPIDARLPVPPDEPGDLRTGDVTIGERAWLGWGSVVLPGVRIGTHAVLGANSVATADIPDHAVAVGNPAKVIRRYDPERGAWRSVTAGEDT